MGGIGYRLRQFWNALHARPDEGDMRIARSILAPELLALFLRMQPGEQAHSLAVMKRLLLAKGEGANNPNGQKEPKSNEFMPAALASPERQDLLVAALLHDVGKCRYPLRLWERVVIVLARAVFPGRVVAQWGRGEPLGWRRPFVIAEQHPAWGAELAVSAGASPPVVMLIRNHQNPSSLSAVIKVDRMLAELQAADQMN